VQPFIRYEVPDRAAISAEPCRCGSPFPRITTLEGRSADIFWVEDGAAQRFLSGVLFHSAADSLGYVREWQAIQSRRNHIDIFLELLPGKERPANEIEAVLYHQLSASGLPQSVDIHVEVVPELAPDPKTGKFRRMISQVGPPEGAKL
jgi:phenylacetate-coenzyme A ligase PaaK-like adenylate-forming protein